MLQKLLLIALSMLIAQCALTQVKMPVLTADSTAVNIRINGQIVAGWNIAPETKPWTEPDVFTIDRSLHPRQVEYLSNRDSLSFLVKPGDRYNFLIEVKDRGLFPMGLATFPLPAIQQPVVMLIVYASLLCVALLIGYQEKMLPGLFLKMGIVAPLLFWLLTIAGAVIHGGYNHLHQVVSELGAIGTKSQMLMSAGETLLGLLTAFSAIGLYRACRQAGINGIPALTLFSLSFSMLWAAFFPMHHELHGAMGPAPLMLTAGVLASIFLWRNNQYKQLRVLSTISFLFMMLILLRTVPAFRDEWEGLFQRFFYTGWTIWSIGISRFFIRRSAGPTHSVSAST